MSNLKKIEALVDSIGVFNGVLDPPSDANTLRNPLLVKSFGAPGKHEIDEQGRRVFDSLVSGYRAAIFDLKCKIEGDSRTKLQPTDRIRNLLGTYGIKDAGPTEQIIRHLRKSLNDLYISADTPLSYFLT